MGNVSIYFWGSYIMLSVLFGMLGKDTKLGFWGVFLMSIFLTPAIGLLVILTAKPKSKKSKSFK